MKLYNCKKVESSKIVKEIIERMENNTYLPSEMIKEVLDDYLIVEQRPEPKKLLMRFTLPFFIIVYVGLFFIISPIKYIITGNYYWKYEGRLVQFMEKWQSML